MTASHLDLLNAMSGWARAGNTFGGRDGPLVHVTSLADTGPGTLREAAEAGGCWIMFDIPGVIELQSQIVVAANTTVDGLFGETVELQGGELIPDLAINSPNVIVAGITCDNGWPDWTVAGVDGANADNIAIRASRVWIYRNTLRRASDGACDLPDGYDQQFVTIQENLFEENHKPILCYGDLVTLADNVFDKCWRRIPQPCGGRVYSTGNVRLGWGARTSIQVKSPGSLYSDGDLFYPSLTAELGEVEAGATFSLYEHHEGSAVTWTGANTGTVDQWFIDQSRLLSPPRLPQDWSEIKNRVTGLAGAPSLPLPPGALSVVAYATANAAQIGIPAEAQVGDTAILFQGSQGSSGAPADVTPAGWGPVSGVATSSNGASWRNTTKLKVLDADDLGNPVTGIAASVSNDKIIVILRGLETPAISGATGNGNTNSAPVEQTITPASGARFVIGEVANSAGGAAFSVASPAFDLEIASNKIRIGIKIHAESPVSHAVNVVPGSGRNFAGGFCLG